MAAVQLGAPAFHPVKCVCGWCEGERGKAVSLIKYKSRSWHFSFCASKESQGALGNKTSPEEREGRLQGALLNCNRTTKGEIPWCFCFPFLGHCRYTLTPIPLPFPFFDCTDSTLHSTRKWSMEIEFTRTMHLLPPIEERVKNKSNQCQALPFLLIHFLNGERRRSATAFHYRSTNMFRPTPFYFQISWNQVFDTSVVLLKISPPLGQQLSIELRSMIIQHWGHRLRCKLMTSSFNSIIQV